jgi:hypothetical protein
MIQKIKTNYSVIIALVILISSCSEEVNNCLGLDSALVTKEFSIDSFENIIVNNQISLFIKDSTHQKIRVR